MEISTVADALAEVFTAEAVTGLALLAAVIVVLARALVTEHRAHRHDLHHEAPR